MKKLFLAVAVSMVFLWASGVASASTFSVKYTAPEFPGYYISSSATLKVGFDIENNGIYINDAFYESIIPAVDFDHETEAVISPLDLTLIVLDMDGDEETFTLSSTNLIAQGTVSWLSSFTVNADDALGDLNADGRVDFSITSVTGDLHVGSLEMTGNIEPKTPDVPIPAAAWLFGTGLIALIGVRRIKFS